MSGSDPGSDSGSDAASQTSTVEYSQEPYEQYQTRVRALLHELYDADIAGRAEFERLKGGSYNRVVGIALPADAGGELVLRVARFDLEDARSDPAHLAAVLRALSGALPVPKIVHVGLSTDNALGRRFLLMLRVPGDPLDTATLGAMSVDARCELAVDLARLIHSIFAFPVPSGIGPLEADDAGELRVGHFEFGSTVTHTLSEFIETRAAEWRAEAQRADPNDVLGVQLCDRLQAAAAILLRGAALSGRNLLFHPDLAGRNILFRNGRITGLLDWDDAQLSPYEVACVCPGWLWHRPGDPEPDEHENFYDPDTPVADDACQRIREAFLTEIELLEPGYLDILRQTRDRCIRILYERARDGFFCNADMEALVVAETAAKKLSS